MAVTRPSNSGTAGQKYRDASAGNTKVADIPGKPTIGTVTVAGTTATIPVTPDSFGGIATLYTATSSPGSLTATSAGTSPINFPSLEANTSYTFTVVASNSTGAGPASDASNSITTSAPPPSLHYVIVGGGSNAGTGQKGAGGGGLVQNANYSLSGIASFDVTVGAAGGTSSFNGINASPGSASTSGNGFAAGNDAGWNGGSGGGGGGGAGGVGANAYGLYFLFSNNTRGFGGDGGPGASTTITGATAHYGAGGGGSANQGQNTHLGHGSGGTGTGGSGANTGGPSSSGRVMLAYGTEYGPLTVPEGLTFTQDTSTRADHRIYTFTAGTGTVVK